QFGNPSAPATQTFTVHETLPTVTISAHDGDGDNRSEERRVGKEGRLRGTATGLAAGATFLITVTDGEFSKTYTATVNHAGTGWTATIPAADAPARADGALTVTAQATDQFGNPSAPATQTFTVHETLPTVTISAHDGDGDN